MMTFRNHRLRDFTVPMSTNWLLNDLAEAKGKQELYTRQSPQVLISRDFTVTDLERLCPGISRDHLRRRLKEMRSAGLIVCIGRGPGAKWRKAKEGHNP
jgi:hypothetical protein